MIENRFRKVHRKTAPYGFDIEDKLARFAHNWPPAPRAYAPEGILEYWNTGMLGLFCIALKKNMIYEINPSWFACFTAFY